ncbi:histidine kinase [Kitasatospora sp. NBC_00374]|uniref:sensor histidine kinase n=1 Tax=Kitasatospora sp. NBC_00374 TaxID=2975964 RepID=UPI0030E18480
MITMETATDTTADDGPGTDTPPVRLGWALVACGATVLCALCWSVLALTHLHEPGISEDYLFDGAQVALFLLLALAGVFILVNRNGRGLGALLVATGLLQCLRMAVGLGAGLAGAGPVAANLVALVVLASDVTYMFMTLGFPLWLPDGTLPRGPWRVIPVLVGLWSVVLGYFNTSSMPDWAGVPNPLLSGGWGEFSAHLHSTLDPIAQDTATATVGFTLAVAGFRWWRSPGPHRGLVEVLVPYLLWMLLVTVPAYTGAQGAWVTYGVSLLGPAGWLLGLAVAFRRDRSVSLDRATRRYVSAYVFCILLFGALLAAALVAHLVWPGGDRSDWWWTMLVAAALGALLRPAARGVVGVVDRYYYGERAHPYQVARRLAERMSRAVDPADAPPLLCEAVVGALGLPGASVLVHTSGGSRELARMGRRDQPVESFRLSYEGMAIGELRVSPRSGQRTLDRQDHEVLGLLADQASPAIASLRLYEDLQASRKRLVLAREEERRRLRHDLHDGLGPALSGLRLKVDAARCRLPAGSPAETSLTAASTGIGQAITELRRITDGLAPAALGSEGLAGALRQLVDGFGGQTLRVLLDLDPDPLPALPAAVEVAVYRISGEALNNVVRHSGATDVRLSLRVGPDEVAVEAHDNGGGFPAHTESVGVGLRSMAERAEELGGTFSAANDACGAVVRAVLPRAAAAEQAG